MTACPYKVLFALSLVAGVLGKGRAHGKVIDDGPQHLSQISSLGESLHNAGPRPLHILYVHGIGATGSGDSQTFQKHLSTLLKGCKVPKVWHPVKRDYADWGEFELGVQPPTVEYMGEKVWMNPEEWRASTPFVDHYVLRRSEGGPVVVDEINWWPLVFPLKCRHIMAGEARLAGPDADLLTLCSVAKAEDTNNPGRFRAYQWVNPEEATRLKSIRSKGALFNRDLKNNPLDWGFSDAIMAVGSMHNLFREGMRQLFVKSVRFNADGLNPDEWKQQLNDAHGIDREFIVVSHSLGSYLVFSTLNMGQQDIAPQDMRTQAKGSGASKEEDDAAQYILERTSLVYFFANQVPLLELANVETPEGAGSLSKRMMKWRDLRQDFRQRRSGAKESTAKPQVVAWSDPSDLLTWHVPGIGDLVVDNLYVRNSWWHWLFASPTSAHVNYAKNKDVLRIMMGPKTSGGKSAQ